MFCKKLKRELDDAIYWKDFYRNRYEEKDKENSELLTKLNKVESKYIDMLKKCCRLEAELEIFKKYCKLGEEPTDDVKEKIFKDIEVCELKEQLDNTQNQLLSVGQYANITASIIELARCGLAYNPLVPPVYRW